MHTKGVLQKKHRNMKCIRRTDFILLAAKKKNKKRYEKQHLIWSKRSFSSWSIKTHTLTYVVLGFIHPIIIIIILFQVSLCSVWECVQVVVAAEQFAGLAWEGRPAQPTEGTSDWASLFLLVLLLAQRAWVLLLPHAPQNKGGARWLLGLAGSRPEMGRGPPDLTAAWSVLKGKTLFQAFRSWDVKHTKVLTGSSRG